MTSESLVSLSITELTGFRFGNFIGEADESDEESEHELNGRTAYDLDDEAPEEESANNQQLMEIDGASLFRLTGSI